METAKGSGPEFESSREQFLRSATGNIITTNIGEIKSSKNPTKIISKIRFEDVVPVLKEIGRRIDDAGHPNVTLQMTAGQLQYILLVLNHKNPSETKFRELCETKYNEEKAFRDKFTQTSTNLIIWNRIILFSVILIAVMIIFLFFKSL